MNYQQKHLNIALSWGIVRHMRAIFSGDLVAIANKTNDDELLGKALELETAFLAYFSALETLDKRTFRRDENGEIIEVIE